MGLWSARQASLAVARALAAECLRALALGKDPLAERKGERANRLPQQQRTVSFDQCAQAQIEAHRDGWRNGKHASQWGTILRRHASPVIANLPADEVELRHVLLALEPIWRSRTETASRLGARIESVHDKNAGNRAK
jgi:hypothetical protein